MEEMASLWSYQENVDELNQKLLYTTLELEKLKAETSEEMIKNKEYVTQLIQLLKIAIQERNEARIHLQNYLNRSLPLTSPTEHLPAVPLAQADSPLLKPGKANLSITESNSLSETYNYQSRCSSPIDSLFDAVTSPELSNINLVVNQPLVQDSNVVNVTVSTNQVTPCMPRVDRASLIIDNLAARRALPQRGKLLQAVVEAGPLLQTLMMAGSLPRWRNPPRLQPFQVPPVSIKGPETEVSAQKPESNFNQMASSRGMNSQPYAMVSCGSSKILSTPMLNFANVPSGSCLGSAGTTTNNSIPLIKRQKLY
ncbi:uncharacterized protein LOC111407724 [Olea europaea var. sylvestris]|uniref:uncharacterized protein LOC111407724 n=1 Tax=Olea europaea var. sylvestris TaxID=158386 RepID=UPI000C1CDB26|nr:uncharacterized protein LOC111407724 [Olea europaea var. sylvestris]